MSHGRGELRHSGALSYYTFGAGSAPASATSNQHGPDSIRFYTDQTVTSRWPSGTKEGAELVIPTMR